MRVWQADTPALIPRLGCLLLSDLYNADVEELIKKGDDELVEVDEVESPYDDERAFIANLLLKFLDAYGSVNGPDEDGSEFLDYYYGDQNQSVKSWQRDVPVNMCNPLIETQVGLITDEPQYLTVVSRKPEKEFYSTFKTFVVNEVQEDNNHEVLLPQLIRAAKQLGTAWIKTWYDKDTDKIKYDARDARNVCLDPGATYRDLGDAEFIFEWQIKPIEQVKLDYERAKYIDVEDDVDPKAGAGWVEDILNIGTKARKDHIALLECHYRYYTGRGKKKKMVVRRVLIARNVILEYEEDTGRKMFPYVPLQNMGNRDNPTNEITGCSDIRLIRPIQDEVNRTVTQIIAIREYMINPRVIISSTSGLFENITELSGGPGEVWPLEDVNDVRFESGDGPNRVLYEHLKFLQESAEMILGIYDVTQGRRAKNIVAGYAIERLQEAGRTRPREFQRALKQTLRILGKHIIELIGINYSAERQIAISGYEGNRLNDLYTNMNQDQNDYNEAVDTVNQMNMQPENKGEPTSLPIQPTGNNTQTGAPTSQQKFFFAFKGDKIFDEMDDDIRVENATFLPTDKQARSDLYLQMYEGQLVDREAVHSALKLPDSQEILERMEQTEQMQQQMEQMQQQAQQQGQQLQQAQQQMQQMQMMLQQQQQQPQMGMPQGMPQQMPPQGMVG